MSLVVQTEFPDFELVHSLSVFVLDGNADDQADKMHCLKKIGKACTHACTPPRAHERMHAHKHTNTHTHTHTRMLTFQMQHMYAPTHPCMRARMGHAAAHTRASCMHALHARTHPHATHACTSAHALRACQCRRTYRGIRMPHAYACNNAHTHRIHMQVQHIAHLSLAGMAIGCHEAR